MPKIVLAWKAGQYNFRVKTEEKIAECTLKRIDYNDADVLGRLFQLIDCYISDSFVFPKIPPQDFSGKTEVVWIKKA